MQGYQDKLRRGFEGLCVAHYPGVRRYLLAVSRDAHLAEDLAQETFLAAYRGLHRFEPGRDFGAYLRGIARNLFLKSRRHMPALKMEVVEALDQLFTREERAGFDMLAALERCLGRLEDQDARLVRGHYDEDKALGSLAHQLGLSLSAVKVRLHRARQRLRECIEAKLMSAEAT